MNIGKLNLDIRVSDCSSCKNIAVADHSFYLETPIFPKLQVALPGSNLKYTFDFIPNQINIFNSYSLGYSSSNQTDELVDLPDGLYTLTYMICPYDELFETVYYIRQCRAWCNWETFLKASFDSCLDLSPEVEKLLNRIEYLLKGAKSFAESCEPAKAMELHQKAVELLNRLQCIM